MIQALTGLSLSGISILPWAQYDLIALPAALDPVPMTSLIRRQRARTHVE